MVNKIFPDLGLTFFFKLWNDKKMYVFSINLLNIIFFVYYIIYNVYWSVLFTFYN